MGFTLQGLAPPGQRYPSRGLASRVVSPRQQADGPRLQRFTLTGKGPGVPTARRRRWPNLALLGFCPSKAFSSTTLGPASRPKPLVPFRPKVLPTFPLPGGASGDYASSGSGWPLSRLPAFLGFRTFSIGECLLGRLTEPGLLLHPSFWRARHHWLVRNGGDG